MKEAAIVKSAEVGIGGLKYDETGVEVRSGRFEKRLRMLHVMLHWTNFSVKGCEERIKSLRNQRIGMKLNQLEGIRLLVHDKLLRMVNRLVYSSCGGKPLGYSRYDI